MSLNARQSLLPTSKEIEVSTNISNSQVSTDGDDVEIPPPFLALQQACDSPVLWIIDNLGLDEDFPYALADELGGRHFEKLAVVLVSHGGSATAAFKAAVVLRRHVDPGGLLFALPAHAESAATLMSLVADSIVMSETASLSAMDIQNGENLLDGTTTLVSSLCLAEGFDVLGDLVLSMQDKAAKRISRYTNLSEAETVHAANDLVSSLLEPVVAHVDVEIIGSRSRDNQLAHQLGSRLLEMANVVPEENRAHVLAKLISGYGYHGFTVMAQEAQNLGLPVVDAGECFGNALRDLAFLRNWTDDRFVDLLDLEDTPAYDVVLTDAGVHKISVAHVVRQYADLGVKESRELIASPPVVVARNVTSRQAGDIKGRLESAGASAEVEEADSAAVDEGVSSDA